MARERRRISIRSMSAEDAALASIGSRERDESLHLARGPNFEFHARSIGPYLRDGRSRSGDIRERRPSRGQLESYVESEHDLVRFLVAPMSELAPLAHDKETALRQHTN